VTTDHYTDSDTSRDEGTSCKQAACIQNSILCDEDHDQDSKVQNHDFTGVSS